MKHFTLPDDRASLAPILSVPSFATEHEKRTRLRTEMRALEATLRETEAKLHALLTRDHGEEADRLAAALIAGDPAETADTVEVLTARASDLRLRIGAYKRADVLQRNAMAEHRAELSVGAADALEPAHRAAVGKLVAAIEAMNEALAETSVIRAQLYEAGYDQRLPEMRPPFSFNPNDYGHATWLSTARSYAQ